MNDDMTTFDSDDFNDPAYRDWEREMSEWSERLETPLFKEARAVTDAVHEMLEEEEKHCFTVNKNTKLQRVSLSLPKPLVYLATYIAIRERHNDPSTSPLWQSHLDGDAAHLTTRIRNDNLTATLTEHLWNDLHWLATGGHHVLYPEKTAKRGVASFKKPDQRYRITIEILRLALLSLVSEAPDYDIEKPLPREDSGKPDIATSPCAVVATAYDLAGIQIAIKEASESSTIDDDIPF
ncbi:MAG: hypothetical protein H6868_10485 [Rhodospirillales bacterium]|nr:hypothetical protein [Rhodospirillales bacterium]